MRKLILISALLLASAAAQAGEGRGLLLAANDTPAAPVTTETVQPEAASAPQTAKPQASQPAKKSHVQRRESDEAKARRIAAKYGISW